MRVGRALLVLSVLAVFGALVGGTLGRTLGAWVDWVVGAVGFIAGFATFDWVFEDRAS